MARPSALLLRHSWWILEMGQAETCSAACPTCSPYGQWPEKSSQRQQQERECSSSPTRVPPGRCALAWLYWPRLSVVSLPTCVLPFPVFVLAQKIGTIRVSEDIQSLATGEVWSWISKDILPQSEQRFPFSMEVPWHVLFMMNSSHYTDGREVLYCHSEQHITS